MKNTKNLLASAVLFTLTALFSFGQVAPGVGSPGASAGATGTGGTPGSGSVQSVSVVPSSTVVGTVDNPTTTPAITLTALGVTPPASGNQLISGGGVDFVSGLQFTVGSATYIIQGTQYTSPITTLTAAAADPTNPRIDIVAVNSSGAAVIIQGTPAVDPVAPDVDPTTQLALTFYILPATATVLPVTVNDIYHENTEWTTSKVGAGINLASTNNPYRGTVDIEGTAVVSGNSFTFTAPSTFDPGAYAVLFFYIAPKASWPNAKQFSVQLLNSSGTPIGTLVTFKSGTFGFVSSGTANAYQQVAIPVSLFGSNGQTAQGLKFTLAGGGSSIGFYMDDFTLQAGLSPTTQTNGMVWRGPYAATTAYLLNDVVTSGPGTTAYVAIAASQGQTPASSPTFWQVASNPGTVTNLTGPITSVGNATSVAAQTGTGSTFVMNTSPTIAGGTLSGTTTQTGTTILTPAPMGAFVIDVDQRLNTKTVSTAPTFTFSGTPAVGQWFGLEVSNSTAGDLTCTIPTSTLVNTTPGGTTTSVTLPASGKLNLAWRYDGSVYNLYTGGSGGGTPGGSSGDYQYNNAGAFGGKTPGTGVDTAFQTAINTNGGFVTATGAPGTSGNVLTSNGTSWTSAAPAASSPLTTKGDIYTYSTTNARLAVGANGTILMADSTQTTGNKWSTATYPATAGTSGDVLTSDGTNWTSSSVTSNIGAQTIWIPAQAMNATVTNGSTYATFTQTTATDPDIAAIEFDPSTKQYAQFSIAMPKSWNAGTITAQFIWSHPATTTNFGVVWGIQAVDVADNAAIGVSFGTAQTVTDTGGTTNNLYISSYTSAVTVGGTPAATDLVYFQVYRDATNGSDTLAVNARLIGVRLIYTTNAANDN